MRARAARIRGRSGPNAGDLRVVLSPPRSAAGQKRGRGQKIRTGAAGQISVVSGTGRVYLAGKRRKNGGGFELLQPLSKSCAED